MPASAWKDNSMVQRYDDMTSCAAVMAQTLHDLGVNRMFGLPGGEILDFVEACRAIGIDFVLTRDEATAAFMADATGQL